MPKRKTPPVVAEPIQVYLTAPDRDLLDQAADAASLSRAEVLRQGLRRFAAATLVRENPVAAYLDAIAAESWEGTPSDAGRRHDEYLTERPPAPRRGARSRG